MIKKIIKAIENAEERTREDLDIIYGRVSESNSKDDTIQKLSVTVNHQSNLLEQIINNKFESDNTELDTVVLIPYRGKPYVYKDGQRINTDKASSFNVNWATDSKTEVNVYNE